MTTERISYGPDEGAVLLGIGRDLFYRCIKEGQIKAKRLGSRTLILREELERFAKTLPDLAEPRPDRAQGHSRRKKAAA